MNLRPASYLFFSLADANIWLLINLLPDHVVFNLIKNRPWKKLTLKSQKRLIAFLIPRVKSLLMQRSCHSKMFSSCLSRSTLGRVLLDILGVQNELHTGMTAVKKDLRIPHAWLTSLGKKLTPGINANDDCHILTL